MKKPTNPTKYAIWHEKIKKIEESSSLFALKGVFWRDKGRIFQKIKNFFQKSENFFLKPLKFLEKFDIIK